jgi:hypothetical protein
MRQPGVTHPKTTRNGRSGQGVSHPTEAPPPSATLMGRVTLGLPSPPLPRVTDTGCSDLGGLEEVVERQRLPAATTTTSTSTRR